MTPNDDVDRQLRARKQQSAEDDSAEIEAASFKKFPVEVNSLARVRMGGNGESEGESEGECEGEGENEGENEGESEGECEGESEGESEGENEGERGCG